jgi:hypothetical protein
LQAGPAAPCQHAFGPKVKLNFVLWRVKQTQAAKDVGPLVVGVCWWCVMGLLSAQAGQRA